MRQREGVRIVDCDGIAPGGKRDVPLGVIVDQEGAKKLGKQGHLSECRVLSVELIEIDDALETLEGQLDLPAKAIELEGLLDGELLWGGRCQEHHVFARFQGA